MILKGSPLKKTNDTQPLPVYYRVYSKYQDVSPNQKINNQKKEESPNSVQRSEALRS